LYWRSTFYLLYGDLFESDCAWIISWLISETSLYLKDTHCLAIFRLWQYPYKDLLASLSRFVLFGGTF
jgi:hypothetical protein